MSHISRARWCSKEVKGRAFLNASVRIFKTWIWSPFFFNTLGCTQEISFWIVWTYRVQVRSIQSLLHFRLQNFRYQGSVSALLYAQPLKGLRSKKCHSNMRVKCACFFVRSSFILLSTFFFFTWWQDVTEPVGGRGAQRAAGENACVTRGWWCRSPFFYFLLLPKLLVVRPLHRTQIKQQQKKKRHRALNINDAIWPAILV